MNHVECKGGNKMLEILEIEYMEIRIAIKIIQSHNTEKENRIMNRLQSCFCVLCSQET